MLQDLKPMAFFVKTVELGSFRACADHFRISASVVSQHIAVLEAVYGVALLYRSTRKLRVTEEGLRFFEEARLMLDAAETALNGLKQDQVQPRGTLRIAMSLAHLHGPVHRAISGFASEYPDVSLDIFYSDIQTDLITEGIDVAIRTGRLNDSGFKSVKVGCLTRKLVVSPDYYSRQPEPKCLSDLQNWDWIRMRMMPPVRVFFGPNNEKFEMHHSSRIQLDSVNAMAEFTIAGHGLSTPPDSLIDDAIDDGRLLRLFPEWSVASMDIHALWHSNASPKSLTALMVNWLKKKADGL